MVLYLRKEDPFEQIVHLAKELNMDLIVMGTYGRKRCREDSYR